MLVDQLSEEERPPMDKLDRPRLPIGYWLKRADEAITKHVNDVQTVNGVSRTDWQVLSLLREAGSANEERLLETMRPFVDATGLHEIIARLATRGWILQGSDGPGSAADIRLTDEGQRTHAAILALQNDVRRKAMQGISEEEYTTVINVLQRMVTNLEGSSDSTRQQSGRA